MFLFIRILFTMFIAEMGDKTQLLMIAMTSRFKMRHIIIGSVFSIMALNLLAVAFGAIISQFIPTWLIKLIAGLAFFYFAWSTLNNRDDGEEEEARKGSAHPILIVFGTFFLAELGDKTQLTAIAFAASDGNTIPRAVIIWAACTIGLFAADVVGMLAGYIIEKKLPNGFLDILAFAIFAIFGFTTVLEGAGLLFEAVGVAAMFRWLVTVGVAAVFVILCLLTFYRQRKKKRAAAAAVEQTASEPEAQIHADTKEAVEETVNAVHLEPGAQVHADTREAVEETVNAVHLEQGAKKVP